MKKRTYHRSLFLNGPAGRLEASLWTAPRAAVPLAALVCHPHPLYGGTLHNKVVFAAARALNRLGLPVLRFNFRGAGLSEGEHDGGRGEAGDVGAALDFLSEEFSERPLLVAGFSFGAWVGLRVGCADQRVKELIGLGLPVNGSSHSFLLECAKPGLFIHGSRDEHGEVEKVRELMAQMKEPKRLVVVEGADHFFAGRLGRVAEAIQSWLRERHPELSA
jgi:uncharacterized protein